MVLSAVLHSLAEFVEQVPEGEPDYFYEGPCPRTGAWLRLPRTPLARAVAQGLIAQLQKDERYQQEGKMYGVLVVETSSGEKGVLKAFSGELVGIEPTGWVPSLLGREHLALVEAQTLSALDAIRQEMKWLQHRLDRSPFHELAQQLEQQRRQLKVRHDRRRQERAQLRQELIESLSHQELDQALAGLDEESRRDGIERKQLKKKCDRILHPLRQTVEEISAEISTLKRQQRQLSRQLQAHMHEAYKLINFGGDSAALAQLGDLPTGTGSCAAPKLLQYAARHGLKPLTMAEFWWGPPAADKQTGEFYGACQERCQPIMGFLLSGLSGAPATPDAAAPQPSPESTPASTAELPLLYEDEWLVAVNKPAGLLSVPGRTLEKQDSVLLRLQHQIGVDQLFPVHRLDQDTSGVLLLAKDIATYKDLQQQFEQQEVTKVYEAVLSEPVPVTSGEILLPLWGDPQDRPRQSVNWQQGKPSHTDYRILEDGTRVEFWPQTGRTHQLRVHSAHPQGLNSPILGDRLYGGYPANRLYLHAKEMMLRHPQTTQPIKFTAPLPF